MKKVIGIDFGTSKTAVYLTKKGVLYNEPTVVALNKETKKVINAGYLAFKLLGKKENPYPYIKKADYFCLLSRFEGYGMVLEEAKILDKPIIITDTAAREAVENYENARIFKNTEDGIYNGLENIILNNNKEKLKNDNKFEYDNKNIIEKIERLMEE